MGGLARQSPRMSARMANLTVCLFATFLVPLLSQTKFSDSQKAKDVDEKIFTGDPTIDTLGGGLIGVGLGALGASILGPTIGQVLGGGGPGFGQQAQTQGCGGRRSQTPSFLETCLGEMIRIVVPVATVKAITKAPARAASTKGTTTRATITRATTTRDANVTIASCSRTRMAGS